jgi:xanthine/uracil permease
VLHLPITMLYLARSEAQVLALVSAVVIAGAIGALVQAFRARGWCGWLWALAAYAIAALPYACPRWPGIFNEFSGGLTFIAGDVTVLVLALRGLRDQQRR